MILDYLDPLSHVAPREERTGEDRLERSRETPDTDERDSTREDHGTDRVRGDLEGEYREEGDHIDDYV